MDQEYIRDELQTVLNMLNADEYPESCDWISSQLASEEIEFDAYELATHLCVLDSGSEMIMPLFDLIVELYETAIENGDVNAMNDLGAFYYDGHGCKRDYSKAFSYYEMAANHGHRLAQENLGYCYYYGRDVEKDYEKAYHYFALGALSGMPVSLYKLGDMYQNGYYVEKNEKEAFRIYDHCMQLINEESAPFVAGPVWLRLGNAFLNGYGTEQNAENALFCYQNAERYLYDMVKNGNKMYSESLIAAIDGQTKARELLFSVLNKKNEEEITKARKVPGPYASVLFYRTTGKITRTLDSDEVEPLISYAKETTSKTRDSIVFSKKTGEVIMYFTGSTQTEENGNLGHIDEYCPGLLEAVNQV